MPRPNKIWFRKDVGWWMITVAGKRIRLAQGRQCKKEKAQQKFHELAAERAQAPESPTARVADVIESVPRLRPKFTLAARETNRNYIWFLAVRFTRTLWLSRSCGTEADPRHPLEWTRRDGTKQLSGMLHSRARR